MPIFHTTLHFFQPLQDRDLYKLYWTHYPPLYFIYLASPLQSAQSHFENTSIQLQFYLLWCFHHTLPWVWEGWQWVRRCGWDSHELLPWWVGSGGVAWEADGWRQGDPLSGRLWPPTQSCPLLLRLRGCGGVGHEWMIRGRLIWTI